MYLDRNPTLNRKPPSDPFGRTEELRRRKKRRDKGGGAGGALLFTLKRPRGIGLVIVKIPRSN